jgi:ferredoxin
MLSQTIFFSPTNSTLKITTTITDALNFEKLQDLNLTFPSKRKIENIGAEADILIFGAPVYVGKIPSMIIPTIKNMIGKNRWIIPIAVYGNARKGNTLSEMIYFFRKQGFKILAAASFIGEHSFTSDDFKLAENRPDYNDLRLARNFGQEIRKKLESSPNEIEKVGQKPDISQLNSEYGARKLIDIIRAHDENCNRCMGCWSICPTEAIDMITLEINEDECIRCCACVKCCKFDVREIIITMTPETKDIFMEFSKIRKEPEFFL